MKSRNIKLLVSLGALLAVALGTLAVPETANAASRVITARCDATNGYLIRHGDGAYVGKATFYNSGSRTTHFYDSEQVRKHHHGHTVEVPPKTTYVIKWHEVNGIRKKKNCYLV